MTAADPVSFERGSFRDRDGRVFVHGECIYRAMSPAALHNWKAVAGRPFLQEAMHRGKIVKTEFVPSMAEVVQRAGYAGALRHERVPLISWPYEWSFSMLREAALLQLDLMQQALAGGAILKDASAYNFQFRGTQPVLIDVGSVVPLEHGRSWDGYRQFCQLFLFPLMLQAWKGIHFQPWLRGAIDGITPEQFASLLSMRDLFRRGALTHVWLHARLQSGSSKQKRVAASLRDSGFNGEMIQNNVAGLRTIVSGLKWSPSASTWSGYDLSAEPVLRDAAEKEKFIEDICSAQNAGTVWDLGCNQGRYSEIAARHASLVLALDSDHLTVDRLFQSLYRRGHTRIVPLVCNLADPAPSLGWRCAERSSLEQRSKPDLVFCLALIHHLVIGANLLLADVVDWLASLHAAVVIEFVDREDPQVRQLLANRSDVFSDYNRDAFRNLIGRYFCIEREHQLPSRLRTLFLLRPRTHN